MSHFTMEKLEDWQSRETSAMRESCGDKILFANIRSPLARSVLNLVRKFGKPPTAEANISEVTKRLDEIVALHDTKELQTFLVFDADKTL